MRNTKSQNEYYENARSKKNSKRKNRRQNQPAKE